MTSLIRSLDTALSEENSSEQYPGRKLPGFFLIVFLLSIQHSNAWAARIGNPVQARKAKESLHQLAIEKQEQADEARMAFRYVSREPYVPPQYDYGLELGSAHAEMNYYSVGANVGFHLGRCVFSNTYTCQNYLDLIGDVNGRDGHTHYLGLASLRWQYISFPSSWSPMIRILAGMNNQITPAGVDQFFTYGIGLGLTTYLHPKADMKMEVRILQSDIVYSQVLFSIQFKMEKWVEYFAEKLKDLGVGTASVTGSVIKGSANVVGGVVEGAGNLTGLSKEKPETKSDTLSESEKSKVESKKSNSR